MRNLLALILFSGLSSPAVATLGEVEVNVIVDMTPEGRKVLRPDPAHPAYYVLVVGGYTGRGASVGHEKPPPLEAIMNPVGAALARQGYLTANPTLRVNARGEVTYADGTIVMVPPHPLRPGEGPERMRLVPLSAEMIKSAAGPYSSRAAQLAASKGQPSPLAQITQVVDPVHGSVLRHDPSLILVVHWGYISPGDTGESYGSPALGQSTIIQAQAMAEGGESLSNTQEGLALVGGRYADELSGINLWDHDQIATKAREGRYFIVVTAFDYRSYFKIRKKTPLWQAKVSVPWNGVTFDQVIPSLVHVVEPIFGREVYEPKIEMEPVVPLGRVIIGTPTEKKDQDSSTTGVGASLPSETK